MFENPRRDRQARNFTTNAPKILDLKSSSEQIFPENCRWVPLKFVSFVFLIVKAEADWLFTDKSFGFLIKNDCTMIVLQLLSLLVL